MKKGVLNQKRFVLILVGVLLTCGAHGISYALAPEEIAEISLRSTVFIADASGNGSGFVVGEGQVATNHHVIDRMVNGTVKLVGENMEYPIRRVLGVDRARDLAVIEVSGLRAPVLPFGDSDAVQVGQAVYAVGNPLGLEGTFSPGVISAIRPEGNRLVAGKVLQITAPISPGSSGGPVLDSNAEVIGIAVGAYTQGQNLNIAIPVNYLKELLKGIEDGTVLPPITEPTTDSFIYWTDWGTNRIQRANLDGSNVQTLVSRGLVSPNGIAVDVAGGKMYWTDFGTDRIQRANLDGSNVQTLVSRGLENPAEIALDVTGGKMYWTDFGEQGTGARYGKENIKRANLDGSNIETLVTRSHTRLEWPEGIALAVAGGKMYWTDFAAGRIQRANLDGSNVQTLVSRGLENPTGIALDVAAGKMYWTDYVAGRIQRANLDGSNVQTLVTRGLESPTGIALDVAAGKMYWTDFGEVGPGARFGKEKIQRANLDGSNVETLVTRAQGLTKLGHIAVGVPSSPPQIVQQSDLVINPPSVSKSTLAPGENFTLSATVRNVGAGNAPATTLRYYRSADATISLRDTEVGTDSVSSLSANRTADESIRLTAPTSPGTYYYGACVDSVDNEDNTANNCSGAVQITVEPPPESDLVVDQPSVSKSTLASGENFTLSATVRNQGKARADGTTLRYYRSADATISLRDTEVGTDSVSSLSANRTADESIRLTAPTSPGTYYYGACVDSVDNEDNTANNCSGAVQITVEPPPESDLVVDQPSVSKSTLASGENFTLSATVRNQGKARADGTTLRYYRSADAAISSSDTEVGTDSVNALGANQTGDESITLTAPTSAGVYYYGACVDTVDNETATANNCSDAVQITVERVPTELVKLSGDNQSGVIGEVLSSPFVVEVRDQDGTPLEGVTVMFAVTGGSGMLSAPTATTDAAGLAETTLTLGSTPGANTVSATVDGIPQGVTFNAMGEGIEFDLSVSAGPNLIHVPLKVTAVDGAAKTIDSIADLYDALGGANAVNFLITYEPSTQAWLSYFSTADRGANQVLTDDMGIVAGMKVEATVRLRGEPLGTDGSSAISLTPGLNLVGLPLRDPTINRVSDLLRLDGIWGNVDVIILNDGGDFKIVGRADDPGDIAITGAQGFILTADQAATVTLSGEGWSNDSATAAPQILTGLPVSDTTAVLALKGFIVDGVSAVNLTGFRVAVKNLSTGRQVVTTTADAEAGYRLAVVDIETMRAARIGDVLEITAQSTSPFIGVKPLRYTVTAEDVSQGWIRLPALGAYEIPKETELLANYPNPFNPETWIPYRLAEDAFVTLTIYDQSGQVVRTLEVGHQIAAVYETRSKAIYWDGRNELGETVASGVYFYHLAADDYSATRKMLILK